MVNSFIWKRKETKVWIPRDFSAEIFRNVRFERIYSYGVREGVCHLLFSSFFSMPLARERDSGRKRNTTLDFFFFLSFSLLTLTFS